MCQNTASTVSVLNYSVIRGLDPRIHAFPSTHVERGHDGQCIESPRQIHHHLAGGAGIERGKALLIVAEANAMGNHRRHIQP